MIPLTQFIFEDNKDLFKLEKHCNTDPDYKSFISTNINNIWNILQEAYQHLGGFHGIQSKKDFKKKIVMVKCVYYKDTIVAVSIYNKYIPENKCVGIASIQGRLHKAGVVGVKLILRDDTINWKDYIYIEADLNMEKICKEVGSFNLPNVYIPELLQDKGKINLWDDGYHYSRILKSNKSEIVKTVFGIPNEDIYNKIIKEYTQYLQKFFDDIDKHEVNIDYSKLNESESSIYTHSPIDTARNIITTFYVWYEDYGILEYPKEIIQRLKDSIVKIQKLYKAGQYDKKHSDLYPAIIDLGKELLSKTIEFKPVIYKI